MMKCSEQDLARDIAERKQESLYRLQTRVLLVFKALGAAETALNKLGHEFHEEIFELVGILQTAGMMSGGGPGRPPTEDVAKRLIEIAEIV